MSADSPAPITHCDRCGAELTPGARYCANCGQEVSTADADTPSTVESAYWSDSAPNAEWRPSAPAVATLPNAYVDDSGTRIGKLFSGSGRIGRLEWALTVLGIWLFIVVTWGIVIGVNAPGVTILLGFASLILSVVVGTCAGVKRLHDFDQSGWLYLLMLVPIVGFILLLALLIAGPNPGPNQYGPEDSGSVIR